MTFRNCNDKSNNIESLDTYIKIYTSIYAIRHNSENASTFIQSIHLFYQANLIPLFKKEIVKKIVTGLNSLLQQKHSILPPNFVNDHFLCHGENYVIQEKNMLRFTQPYLTMNDNTRKGKMWLLYAFTYALCDRNLKNTQEMSSDSETMRTISIIKNNDASAHYLLCKLALADRQNTDGNEPLCLNELDNICQALFPDEYAKQRREQRSILIRGKALIQPIVDATMRAILTTRTALMVTTAVCGCYLLYRSGYISCMCGRIRSYWQITYQTS